MLRAILHADKKWGIGKRNTLMFSLPKDMSFFRETTKGKVVAMGENTLLSFPNGQPLKNRVNLVLCQKEFEKQENLITVSSFDEFKNKIASYLKTQDVFIIGGASIYRQMLPYCEEVLLTKVDADGGAEVFFPNLDEDENFVLDNESEPTTDGQYVIRFCVYRNKNVQKL